MVTANFDVLSRLETVLPRAVKLGLFDFMRTMLGEVQRHTPHWKGILQKSWTEESTDTGFVIGTDISYAIVLEEGKYPRPGPRTVASGGKVFSRQAVGGIIKPIYEDQTLIDRCLDFVIEQIKKQIE